MVALSQRSVCKNLSMMTQAPLHLEKFAATEVPGSPVFIFKGVFVRAKTNSEKQRKSEA